MRLGLSTAAYFGRYETEDAATQMRRFDIDCAEVFLQTSSEYTKAFAMQVKECLQGIPVASVHPLGTAYENALFSRSARQKADAFATYDAVLDAAEVLGADMYVYHGNHTAKGVALQPDFARYAPSLAQMVERAGAHGLRLCWENVWWCVMNTPERVERVRTLYPDIGFVLDIKQAMQSGVDAIDFLPAMGERLMNVHVCDYDANGKLCMPGEGIYDFKRLMRALAHSGYTGAIILEPYSDLFTQDAQMERALEVLRRAMQV